MPLLRALTVGVLLAIVAPAAGAADISRLDCRGRDCPVALVSGEIGAGDAARFAEIATAPPAVRLVLFDSPGGRLREGIFIGSTVRRLGAATAVAGYRAPVPGMVPGSCASACYFALIGGVERVAVPGSRVGVHGFTFAAEQAPDGVGGPERVRRMEQSIVENITSQGVDPLPYEMALALPGRPVLWLPRAELFLSRTLTTERRIDLRSPRRQAATR